MNVQVNQNERLIRPSDPAIRYTGRIDNSNPDAPFLIYVCSQVEFRVTGHVLRVFIENIHSFYENRLGVIINGVESAVLLESGAQVIDLSARDIADVTIKADSLEELVILKTIANSLQRRVSANYRFVLTFNSALIALGALGILQPASSAMLHNLSTIGISLKSMTNLIPEEKAQKALAEKN